jgi:glycerophosphoryl diester phosphodiesterase
VPPRHPPLNGPAILFAHRGARAHAPENTLESFRLGLRLGSTGLESDAWVTEDGEVVLDHDGVVGGMLRRRRIREMSREQLPEHIPTLEELYEACGTDFELSLDVKDPDAMDEIIRVARAAGAAGRLWLCHPDVELLETWRERADDVRLVNSTRVAVMEHGPERRAARLRQAGIDAVNLHHSEWSAGLVALFHRFRRTAFGWDAQHPRVISELLHAGIDGIFGDHVDRLVDVTNAVSGTHGPSGR